MNNKCFEARVLTLFPEMFPGPLSYSLAGKAIENKIWNLNTINISNHGYSSGERITYTSQETPVGGLTSGNEYYVTKVNNDSIRLYQVGSGQINSNYY